MKLSISKELHDRAWGCALSTNEKKLTDFIALAVINDAKGLLDDVAFNEKLMLATRDERVVATFDGDANGWAPARVKLALVRAVLFAEPKNPSKFIPDGLDGAEARP